MSFYIRSWSSCTVYIISIYIYICIHTYHDYLWYFRHDIQYVMFKLQMGLSTAGAPFGLSIHFSEAVLRKASIRVGTTGPVRWEVGNRLAVGKLNVDPKHGNGGSWWVWKESVAIFAKSFKVREWTEWIIVTLNYPKNIKQEGLQFDHCKDNINMHWGAKLRQPVHFWMNLQRLGRPSTMVLSRRRLVAWRLQDSDWRFVLQKGNYKFWKRNLIWAHLRSYKHLCKV